MAVNRKKLSSELLALGSIKLFISKIFCQYYKKSFLSDPRHVENNNHIGSDRWMGGSVIETIGSDLKGVEFQLYWIGLFRPIGISNSLILIRLDALLPIPGRIKNDQNEGSIFRRLWSLEQWIIFDHILYNLLEDKTIKIMS